MYVHLELSYIIIISSCEIHLNKDPFTQGILYVHTILRLHWSTGLQIEWCEVITSGHNPVISNKQQRFLSGIVGRRSYGFTDICSRLRNIVMMLSMSLWHGYIEAWKCTFLNENVWLIFSHTLLLQRFTNSAIDHLYGAVNYMRHYTKPKKMTSALYIAEYKLYKVHPIALLWKRYGRVIKMIDFNTVRCLCNAVDFLPTPHKRHPRAHAWGRYMGCLWWVLSLTSVLMLSLHCCI